MIVQEFANQTAVAPHVIRYYTRIGLLTPKRDPGNGYRRFGNRDAERLQFIRMAQQLGFTLRDIKALLAALENGGVSGSKMRDTLQQRLTSARRKRRELERVEQSIEQTLSVLDDAAPQASGPAGFMDWGRSVLASVPQT